MQTIEQKKMQNEKEIVSPASAAVFSIFAGSCLLLLGPINIFAYNSEEFSSSAAEMFTALSLASGIFSLLVFAILFFIPESSKKLLIKVLGIAVISSWVLSTFLYGDYGRLDGTPLTISAWSGRTALQIMAVFFLSFLIFNLALDRVIKLTGFVFVMGVVSSAASLSAIDSKKENTVSESFPPDLLQFSPNKNVLHIVFDELGSDLFIAALESSAQLKKTFDGFTVFSDTLSVYPSTEMSIVVLMTGEIYRNEQSKRSFIKKIREQKTGVNRLEERGFLLDSHTQCQLGVLPRCTNTDSRIITKRPANIEALRVIDIFLFKSVPDFLKPSVYNQEKWLLLAMSNHDDYLKFQSGIAHLLFSEFVDSISVSEKSAPRYKFFHSLVTHSPASLAANCNIVDETQESNAATLEFVKCGLNHFSRLVKKMKKLGIYDNTMIIISSDHGDYWVDGIVPFKAFKERGIPIGITSRAAASLAIKPYNASGPVLFNSAPVSLQDIPQTILETNGIDNHVTKTGISWPRNVFTVSPNETREREYLNYFWEHEFWNKDVLPPITAYRINGKINDPESWPDSRSR